MSAAGAPVGHAEYPRLARVVAALSQQFDDVEAIAGGDEWISRCPMHPQCGRQLFVSTDFAGRAVLDCERHCAAVAIALAVGADPRDVAEPERDGAHGSGPASRFQLLSDVELEQLPALTFLVDGVLPTAGLGAIYGPPAAGKSFLALDMACSIAAGVPWLGRRTTPGCVVYAAAEGSAGYPQRLAAWKAHRGEVRSVPVFFLTEPVNLLVAGDVAQLLATVGTMPEPPVLLIIDTLPRSMPGGDENSAKDMGLVIEHADQFRRATAAAVLFVHHTGKGSELERGSTSLRGAVDTLLYVKADEGRREVQCSKAKDWAAFDAIPFTLLPIGDSCIVQTAEKGGTFEGEGPTAPMLEGLTTLSRDFPASGATFSEWRAATGMAKSSFSRVLTALQARDYITIPTETRGGRYRVTEGGRSVVGPKVHEGSTKVPAPSPTVGSMVPPPIKGGTDGTKGRDVEQP